MVSVYSVCYFCTYCNKCTFSIARYSNPLKAVYRDVFVEKQVKHQHLPFCYATLFLTGHKNPQTANYTIFQSYIQLNNYCYCVVVVQRFSVY